MEGASAMEAAVRKTKHRRNVSEPIHLSPEQRAAAAFMAEEDSPHGRRQQRMAPLNLPFGWRRPPEWTNRSARLVAGTLIALLLLGLCSSVGPGQQQQLGGSETFVLRSPVWLHQTVSSLENVTATEREWRATWERLGFIPQLADDARCREDMQRLVERTGNSDYLRVYDSLETGVQRSDMWRYTALYLYGGVYADVDVIAQPPMAELLNSLPVALNRSGVVFVESLPTPWLIGFIARFLYVTDMVSIVDAASSPSPLLSSPRTPPLLHVPHPTPTLVLLLLPCCTYLTPPQPSSSSSSSAARRSVCRSTETVS
jgi:hypothetical protein